MGPFLLYITYRITSGCLRVLEEIKKRKRSNKSNPLNTNRQDFKSLRQKIVEMITRVDKSNKGKNTKYKK